MKLVWAKSRSRFTRISSSNSIVCTANSSSRTQSVRTNVMKSRATCLPWSLRLTCQRWRKKSSSQQAHSERRTDRSRSISPELPIIMEDLCKVGDLRWTITWVLTENALQRLSKSNWSDSKPSRRSKLMQMIISVCQVEWPRQSLKWQNYRLVVDTKKMSGAFTLTMQTSQSSRVTFPNSSSGSTTQSNISTLC